jgi:hypothetical protein
VSGETVRARYRSVAPTGAWNSGRPIPGADCFSRHISDLKTATEMVIETLAFSSLNHLTRLVAREDFIIKIIVYALIRRAC